MDGKMTLYSIIRSYFPENTEMKTERALNFQVPGIGKNSMPGNWPNMISASL
jgi:hypothetical protein